MIAVIAGTGLLPREACSALLANKQPFFVISLFPEDNLASLQSLGIANLIYTLPFYKAGAILSMLKEQKTTAVLMIGKVDKQHLLKKIKIDLLGLKLLASVLYYNDQVLMQRIVDTLAEHGIQVLRQDEVLRTLILPPGVLTGTVTPALTDDINLGLTTAQRISAYDIGQTVIIKNKMIIAIEAIEGTDACIKRGIELTGGNIVICKAAQPQQNKKFDLPTLGPKTLALLKKGDVAAIAWSASSTLIVEPTTFIDQAQALEITLIAHK